MNSYYIPVQIRRRPSWLGSGAVASDGSSYVSGGKGFGGDSYDPLLTPVSLTNQLMLAWTLTALRYFLSLALYSFLQFHRPTPAYLSPLKTTPNEILPLSVPGLLILSGGVGVP